MNPAFSGRRLTMAALLLSALAGVAGGGYAVRAASRPLPGADGSIPSVPVEALIAEARAAEGRGDLPAALTAYRRAVAARPALLDRNSPAFLGTPFGERLKGWIAGMKAGTVASTAAAGEDASYLFRRLNGGCG